MDDERGVYCLVVLSPWGFDLSFEGSCSTLRSTACPESEALLRNGGSKILPADHAPCAYVGEVGNRARSAFNGEF